MVLVVGLGRRERRGGVQRRGRGRDDEYEECITGFEVMKT